MAEPLPFEELFRPLVVKAGNELRQQIDVAAWELLTSEAHADLSRHLLTRLTGASCEAAYWQFQIFGTVRSIFPANASDGQRPPDAIYRQYIGPLPEKRLRNLFGEFPALAELCSALIRNWCIATGEFLVRLRTDCSGLGTRFSSKDLNFPVSKLQAGLSDPHRSGKSVIRLQFENGQSVVYKPRSVAPEAHFAILLEEINASNIRYPLRSAQCWDRGEYGWMENIDWHPCEDLGGIHAFYWRAGALLGLVHLAQGIDFHEENLIASGACPVLIDLETLWHPQEYAGGEHRDDNFALQRTGVLPQTDLHTGAAYAWSALRGTADREAVSAGWIRVNQDGMAWKSEKRQLPDRRNLPVCDGKIYTATRFVEDIQAGFAWIGEHLLDAGPQQNKFTRWLTALIGCSRRLVRRSTIQYKEMAKHLTSQASLRTAQLTTIWRTEMSRISAPALEEEIQALVQGDIPYFRQADHISANPKGVAALLPSKETFLSGLSEISNALAVDHRSQRPR